MTLPQACAEIQQRCDAATEGPWEVAERFWMIIANDRLLADCIGEFQMGPTEAKANAAFIAHARSDIPLLLRAVAELQAENKRLAEALELAGGWFQGYVEGHRNKGDVEKAARNQERANACFAAAIRTRAAAQPGEGKDNG